MSVSEENVKSFLDMLVRIVPKGAFRFDDYAYLAWYPFLKNFSLDELKWYLDYAGDNLDDFPTIKKIKTSLIERRNGLLSSDPVVALIEGCKNKQSVTEPINQLAAKFGGWSIIGQWPIDQWEFKRKSINEVWESVKKSYRVDTVKVNKSGLEIESQKDRLFKPNTPKELENKFQIVSDIRKQLADAKALRLQP